MSKRAGNVEQVERRFPTDIASHEMTIVQDAGLIRYVKFRQVDRGFSYWFDIATWPGFLCISGDMGCYVFSRITDMFEFFRGKDGIDYGYWAQKLQAVDRNSPAMKWSENEFRNNVDRVFKNHTGYCDVGNYKRRLGLLINEQLRIADLGDSHSAIGAMIKLEIDGQYPFQDFYEYLCEDYTHQFVWCCNAIRWGINQYDAAKVEVANK